MAKRLNWFTPTACATIMSICWAGERATGNTNEPDWLASIRWLRLNKGTPYSCARWATMPNCLLSSGPTTAIAFSSFTSSSKRSCAISELSPESRIAKRNWPVLASGSGISSNALNAMRMELRQRRPKRANFPERGSRTPMVRGSTSPSLLRSFSISWALPRMGWPESASVRTS